METIFWVVFSSGQSKYDRRQYFEEIKSLKEFHLWVEHRRIEIEKKFNTVIALQNMGIITQKIKAEQHHL